MADLFPTDPKRIRERIRRYERVLKREPKIGDGYGKRYLLGPLYMLMGDVEGALASFYWYEDTYPGDSGDPYHYLTWALALYRGDRRQEAFNKLYQTMLENLYLVPFVVGRNPQRLELSHSSNLAWIEYALEAPQELLNLWDDDALQWAREVSDHPIVIENIGRYVAIHREFKSERPGPRRCALVYESFALKTTLIP